MATDLAQIYREHGFTAKLKTSEELCGPCPWCGGKDRFTIFLDQGKDSLGRFWCRQCGKKGDTIQFLRDIDGLSFNEAKAQLGYNTMSYAHSMAMAKIEATRPFEGQETSPPGDIWQQRAKAVVAWASTQIQEKPHVLQWLAKERGLTLQTVKKARLGWLSKDFYRPRKAFGLPEEYKPNGKPRRVWIPKGLCIPVFEGNTLLRVKIRLAEHGENLPKYIPLPQNEKCTAPLVLHCEGEKAPWQIVESELDALLLAQECGHFVNVVAMGSASYRPDKRLWQHLIAAPVVLISLDFDDAGNKAALQWWKRNLPPALFRLWPVPDGKDPCDAWRAGWNLAEWTLAGITECIF